MSNIFNNNFSGRQYKFKLSTKHYYDFFLWNERHGGIGNSDDNSCLVTEINPNNENTIDLKNNKIYSNIIWNQSVNTGIELPNFGLTGLDNGAVEYNRDNDKLIDIFTKTKLEIKKEEKRFYMKPVKGYVYNLDYGYSIEEENNKKFFSFNGGFLQGFYKLFAGVNSDIIKYQTLPNRPNKAWTWEFILRPKNIEKENTLNYYFDNDGIFFYQGLRAENKWWYYSRKLNIDKLENLKAEIEKKSGYFLDDYLDIDKFKKNKSSFETLHTTSGILLNTPNIVEFVSDNKYLIYNRTACGYTTNDKLNFDEFIMSYQKKPQDLNYYLLFNRTENGLTTNDIEPSKGTCMTNNCGDKRDCNPYMRYNLIDKPRQNFPKLLKDIDIYDNTIDINKDVYNNNIAFRITKTGQIGYRLLIQNCEEDRDVNPTKTIEEYSKENIVKYDKWNHIIVKFVFNTFIDNPECSEDPSRKGKLYFYVNGKLKFISKEIDEPIFRELNEFWEKQLGVGYNISLGGGSQGLLETILSDKHDDYDRYNFPIQKYYAGTFFGDIMQFKIYNCELDYLNITRKYKKVKSLLI